MSQFGRRFDPSELPATGGDADLTAVLEMARELEAFSVRDQAHPTVGFEDAVMAAIGNEAPPRLVLASSGSLRRVPRTLLVAFRDAWGVATGLGRPLAVRAQAIAFVAISLLAVGSLSAVVAVGAASLLDVDRPVPQPTVVPVATDGPTPTPSVAPSPSPSPSVSPSPSPTETIEPSPSPTETTEPTETAESSGNSGPGGSGGDDDSSGPGGGDDSGGDDSGGGNSGPGGGGGDDSGSGGSGSSGRGGSDDSGSDDSGSDDSGSDDG